MNHTIELEYEPLPTGALFHSAWQKYKLYGGAMAGGKSTTICAEAIMLSAQYPGNSGVIARKTMKDLKRTTMRTFFELLPPKYIKSYNKTDGIVNLINDSEVMFTDLEHPGKLKSMNLGWFAVDEATEASLDSFTMLKTRLRRKVPNIRYFGLLASNPEPGWVKDEFITKRNYNHIYIPALPKDNFHLPKDYLSDLLTDLPEVWRMKYIEGSWNDFGGQIFPEKYLTPTLNLEKQEFAAKFMAIDPAISEDEAADETAIICMGVDYDEKPKAHEIEMIHGRWSFNESVERIIAAYNKHKPDVICVEVVAYQKALCDVLQGRGVPVIPIRADIDKVRRAISISYMFERGLVRINNPDLKRQLLEFPKGTHDDLVDACVYCLKIIREFSSERYEKTDNPYKGLDGTSIEFWKAHHASKKDNKSENFNNFFRHLF